jgi:hypothetical protein
VIPLTPSIARGLCFRAFAALPKWTGVYTRGRGAYGTSSAAVSRNPGTHTPVNKDFLFACRVCHCPLVAANGDRGAAIDCPNCSAGQSIPIDPAFGASPSTYISDLELLGTGSGDSSGQRHLMLRRVRVRRNSDGQTVRSEVPAILAALPRGIAPGEDFQSIKLEVDALREQLAERDRQLAEWQTCHETVDRELKRASERASALQSKINATSNELAQARSELAKARSEAEANRKANEALNRQLQGILKANQIQPPTVAETSQAAPKRKPGHKAPGELAA